MTFAIRKTVKRIALRREYRRNDRYRITLWDRMIERRDDLGMVSVIELSDDNVPSPGRWRDVVALLRKRGETMYVQEVAEPLGSKRR